MIPGMPYLFLCFCLSHAGGRPPSGRRPCLWAGIAAAIIPRCSLLTLSIIYFFIFLSKSLVQFFRYIYFILFWLFVFIPYSGYFLYFLLFSLFLCYYFFSYYLAISSFITSLRSLWDIKTYSYFHYHPFFSISIFSNLPLDERQKLP